MVNGGFTFWLNFSYLCGGGGSISYLSGLYMGSVYTASKQCLPIAGLPLLVVSFIMFVGIPTLF